jgi:hypothetical protein
MRTQDKLLLVAISASVALHIAALFGTPRFDLEWLYEEVRPAPIEVQLARHEPPPNVAETKPPPPATKKRTARRAPAAKPAPPRERSEAVAVAEAPSPDGESASIVAQAVEAPAAAASEVVAQQPAVEPQVVAEEPAAEYPLKQAELVFDLYYGRSATKVGQVIHTWTQDGERYTAESVAEAVGFISFFFGGRFVQRSVGHMSRTGLLPDQYTLERGRGDKPEVARFDWDDQKLALAWKNESRLVDLPAGAQDPISILHHLYFINPVPAQARLNIATGRKLNKYVYLLIGDELLETPLGMLTTLHFRRQEADGTLMDVWLDQHRNLLPARIYLVDRKGKVLDQVIREARTEFVEGTQ